MSTHRSAGLIVNFVLGWAGVIATLALACFYVPEREANLGNNYLIFFYHFPSAFDCLLFFMIAGGMAIYQLRSGSLHADLRVASSIEVGVLATAICLLTGMIWANAAWGKPWIWHDPRLLSVAVMWFSYVAYLVFRANLDNIEQRARYSSVMAVLFAINVPIVYFAIQLFGRVSHPNPLKMELTPEMKLTQWVGALSFFILYVALWRLRYRSLAAAARADQLEERFIAERI